MVLAHLSHVDLLHNKGLQNVFLSKWTGYMLDGQNFFVRLFHHNSCHNIYFWWDFNIGKWLLFVQGGSNRAAREDPTDWVLETSPWESSKRKGSEAHDFPLRRLFPYGDSPVSREQNQILSTTGNQVLQNSSSHSDPLVNTYFSLFMYWYFWKLLMISVLQWNFKEWGFHIFDHCIQMNLLLINIP